MSDADRLYRLLDHSSRTFALSIPLLPEPLREQIALGYLVFRIADTIEDEGEAQQEQRINALGELYQCLRDDHRVDQLLNDWLKNHPPDHRGYYKLLEQGGWVIDQLHRQLPNATRHIRHYVGRTILGMAERLGNGEEQPDGIPGVRAYCYSVAGIVGELCTELFVLHHPPLTSARERLMEYSVAFGKALQLVNILRDQGVDLAAGRRFVPDDGAREEMLELANQACDRSREYLGMLENHDTPSGILHFNEINLRLATATLSLIRQHGPGVKVSRAMVARTLEDVSA